MSVIEELIRVEVTGELSFGNYKLEQKEKVDEFKHDGDTYKVKTFQEITKLEKNDKFLYESVPGTTVTGLSMKEDEIKFTVEGLSDAQITLELEEGSEYSIILNGEDAGNMSTGLGGKLTLAVELVEGEQSAVIVKKIK